MVNDPITEAVEERLKRARLSESPHYLDTPVDGNLTMGFYLLPNVSEKAEELYIYLRDHELLNKSAASSGFKKDVVRALQNFITFDILEDIKDNFYKSEFWNHHLEKSKELVKR